MDGHDIVQSPYPNFKVRPASINTPSCVLVDVPASTPAGVPLIFYIQGRDRFKNNSKDLLEDFLGRDTASLQAISLADSSVVYDGTITDAEEMPGVFSCQIDFPLDA